MSASVVKSDRLDQAFKELDRIFRTCDKMNWGGYEECPVDLGPINDAKNFLRLVPDDIPFPRIVPTQAGAIALVWDRAGLCGDMLSCYPRGNGVSDVLLINNWIGETTEFVPYGELFDVVREVFGSECKRVQ